VKKEEYHRRIDAIEKKCREKVNALNREYVMANKKYNVGDIISDSSHTIKVDNIGVSCISIHPKAVYHGPQLKKNLQPYKNGDRISIWENSVTKHHRPLGNGVQEYKLKGEVIGDYDIWYQPCGHCGYDTGKSTKLEEPRCWKCGRPIRRDFSKRALKGMLLGDGVQEYKPKGEANG
jgi:hypothetical protein